MKRWIHAATNILSSQIVPNKKIQKGLVWHSDGFTKEVVSVSNNGKTCKILETWISEDTGKPMKKTHNCKIAVDKDGEEYAYDPEYEDYAKPGSDDYSWWARKYASGADNYPYVSVLDTGNYEKGTLGHAFAECQKDADNGDFYDKVKVIVNGKCVYLGNSLEEARQQTSEFLDMPIYKHFWHDDYIEFAVDTRFDDEDDYTPSATRGDYSPSNPWDAPGMSIHDFI